MQVFLEECLISKLLGASLQESLLTLLSTIEPPQEDKKVILFTTVDDGWPRHGMLSRFELVAKNSDRLLMLLYTGAQGLHVP